MTDDQGKRLVTLLADMEEEPALALARSMLDAGYDPLQMLALCRQAILGRLHPQPRHGSNHDRGLAVRLRRRGGSGGDQRRARVRGELSLRGSRADDRGGLLAL